MSMSVSSYSTMSSRKGIGGLASGMNTDELVEQLTAGTREKITSQLQQRQLAMWKRDAYRDISSRLINFSNTYFSYTNNGTNLLSSSFFKVSTPKSSSANVGVSGDALTANRMIIRQIEQLAGKASFTSKHTVSDQKMMSGSINSVWKDNTLAGKSMTIKYGDKAYTLKVSSDFYLDSTELNAGNPGDSQAAQKAQIEAVVNDLNKQISKNADLKGKLSFTLDANNKLTLAQTDSTAEAALRLEGGDINLLTALGLYASDKSAAEGDTDPLFTSITGRDSISVGDFYTSNTLAGSAMVFEIDGKAVSMTLPRDFRFSPEARRGGPDGYTDAALAKQQEELQKAFDDAIADNSALKDVLKAKAEITGTGADKGVSLSFETVPQDGGAAPDIKLLYGSSLEGLGLKAFEEGDTVNSTIASTGAVDMQELFKTVDDSLLKDTLSGVTLTFNFNGVTKTVTFRAEDSDQYADVDGVKTYLQDALNKAFGSDRIFVDTDNGRLTFSTTGVDAGGNPIGDPSSVLTLQGASKAKILGEGGALHIINGESNRLEYNKTLNQLSSQFNGTLNADADGNYKLKVNGVSFTFDGDTLLGDVISRINSHPDTNAEIAYNSVTDVFTANSKESGKHSALNIEDEGGNLAEILFGQRGSLDADGNLVNGDYAVKAGTDARLQISFDGGSTFTWIERSGNTFSIDGVNFELKGITGAAETEDITFSIESNVDDLMEKLKTFINDYNEIVELVTQKTTEKKKGQEDGDSNGQSTYLPLTDEQKKDMSEEDIKLWEENAKKGILRNDQVLYTVFLNMRHAMNDNVGETDRALYQFGISTKAYAYEADGKLEIDEEKLKTALMEDPEQIVSLFTATDTGIAYRMQEVLENAVGFTGRQGILLQVAGREDGMGADQSSMTMRIQEMSKKLSSLKLQLQTEEDRYWTQFTRMEQYLSSMNAQSQWLSQQLGQ